MNKIVDLHTHSIYSDGEYSPRKILDIAKNNNIGILSLTDHDNINGSKELVKYNYEGVYFYSGVELTAKVDKGRMHILGYNIDLDNEELNKRLEEMHEASIYNILLYIELLKKDYNITISEKDINDIISKPGNIGRPQLALKLIELGIVNTVDEAFNKYLRDVYNKVRKLKKGLTKEEAISLIINAGGIPVLAHPVSLELSRYDLEKEIQYLQVLGLKGIERIHTNIKQEDRVFYEHLARKYHLLETGGSDYHGPSVKPDVQIGHGRNNNVRIKENTLSLTKKIKSRYM